MGFYDNLGNTIRKSPFGPARFNAFISNLAYIQSLALAEHLETGEHNAAEVPRTVGKVAWSGAAYSVEGASLARDVTVAAVSTGIVKLTLATGRFSANALPQITAAPDNEVQLPWVTVANLVSPVELRVSIFALALVGGGAALTDANFFVGVHSDPLTTSPSLLPATKVRGDWLTESLTDWNILVRGAATLYKYLLVGHREAGKHKVPEVGREWAWIRWDGSNYSLGGASSGIIGVSGTAGLPTLSYSAIAGPVQALVLDEWSALNSSASNADIHLAHTRGTLVTTTATTISTFTYNRSTDVWAAGGCDLFVVLHGA